MGLWKTARRMIANFSVRFHLLIENRRVRLVGTLTYIVFAVIYTFVRQHSAWVFLRLRELMPSSFYLFGAVQRIELLFR